MSHIKHDEPHGGDIVQALQAQPQGLGAGFAIAFTTQESPETCDAMDGLTQGRGALGTTGFG
nr:hypothetical protein [Acidiferrobacter thiooxydans]